MAYANNYGDVTVKGITYTGKGSESASAVSSWSIDPTTTNYYGWYTNTSPTNTIAQGVSTRATTLYLQYYVADGTTLPNNPYRVGWQGGTSAFGYVREDAFPTGTNTIAYAANGGSSTPTSGTLTYDSTATAASAITRTGYTFAGWKSSKSGTTYGAGATIPTSEYSTYAWNASKPTLTMTAQWTINTYTVSYNANGGSGAPSAQTKTYNVTLTLSSTVPTRTGYTFLGWSTSSTATSATYSAGGSYTANAAAVLYAVWRINTYSVSYNANGGSGTISGQTKTYGVALTLASSGYTRTGYTLTGWNTKADGTGTSYALGASYTTDAAATMYAVWTINTWTVSYNANGGSGTVSSQTKTYGTDLTLRSSGYTRSLYTLSGWNTASNGGGTSYALGGTYSANAAATMYAVWTPVAPTAPTNVTNTRNSDTSNTIAWTNPSAVITTTTIQRSVDGGSFATLTTISGSATSYTDTTTSANHYYAYKVAVANSSGSATSSASGTTYNTPAAPTSLTLSRESSSTVLVTIANPAVTATALELQRSTDASTWTTVSTTTGSPVTSVTDTPGGGTFYYRARNTRSDLASAYTQAASPVVTLQAPAAPTLTAPASGAVVSTATTPIVFTWTHNTIDGSAQTAAELQYSTDSGSTWTTVTVNSSDQSYELANSFATNATVMWRVRTKGAYSAYGEYSASRSFTVYTPPTLSWTSPGSTVDNMPISLELAYSDASGTLAALTVTAADSNGQTVHTVAMGTATSASIEAADWLPTDGETYTLTAKARSTSSLTTAVETSFTVAFVLPDNAVATVTNDPDTDRPTVQVAIDEGSGAASAVSISVYRVSANGRVLLASGLSDGAVITDIYAPLNSVYTYEATSFSAGGAVATTTTSNIIRTSRWHAIFADGEGDAAAVWNPTGSINMRRPQKTRVQYAGRTYPVSYDGTALGDARSMAWTLETLDERDAFMALIADGGRGVYKSCDGDVFHADFELTLSAEFTTPNIYGRAQVSITRIEGEAV